MSTSIGFEEDMGSGSRNYGREAMLKKLGELARRRRDELGLSRDAFVKQAGIGSNATVRRFEFGIMEPTPRTLMKIEKILGWEVGSIAEMLDDEKRNPAEVKMEDLDDYDGSSSTALASFSIQDLLDELSRRIKSLQAGMGAGIPPVKDMYGLAASGGHKPEHLDDDPDDGIDKLNVSPN